MFERHARSIWFEAQQRLAVSSNNLPATLVVVDMLDDRFPASLNENTVAAVTNLMVNARQQGAGIVLLECLGCHTQQRLMALIAGYQNKMIAEKKHNDGSVQVIESCLDLGCCINQFVVCGVNTNYCVLETVLGLLSLVPSCTVQVHKGACNQDTNTNKYTGQIERSNWSRFNDPRIRLV